MKRGIKSGWKALAEAVDEALFPSNIYCICCGSMIDRTRPYGLCDSCIKRLHWINSAHCEVCGKALPETYHGLRCYDCMMYAHSFKQGFSCLTYGLYERQVIFAYKYHGRGYLGKKLGDILYDRISCENLQFDVIIPVPIHKQRERQRGYNQAWIMAGQLGKRCGILAAGNWLRRHKKTPRLRSLNPIEREAALSDAFSLTEVGRRRLPGRRVLLIDDIYTTGATVDACSRVLMEGGAESVFVLTLAAGGNRKPKTLQELQ